MSNYGEPMLGRESSLSTQMTFQEKSIAELSEIITQLEARLERAMTPSNPSVPVKETAVKSEPLSQIVSELRANNGKIDSLCIRLRDVLSRLEL